MSEPQNQPAISPTTPGNDPTSAVHTNLPNRITSFIGRSRELAEARQCLKESRLLTLKGPGGCGKTRLALEIASEAMQDYADGVWLIEMEALADDESIPLTLASTLGVQETAGSNTFLALIQFLQKRSTLLVVDNCEHLRAGCARVIEQILKTSSRVRILATSRNSLGVPGEVTLDVPALELPPDGQTFSLEDLQQVESVRLFVNRARSATSRFQLKPSNAAAVAKICRQLDGLPLAIELAAAQTRVMNVHEIASDLLSLLEETSSLSSTAPDRHRTLNALIEWSVRLLRPEEKTLLLRLSIFAGGWDRRAAAAVCAAGDHSERKTGALLSRLVEASLALCETSEEEEESGQASRYHLLKTVRAYARKQLDASSDAAEVADRFTTYYLGVAEQAEPLLTGKEQCRTLSLLDKELDNLRAALDLAVRSNEIRVRLAAALWRYWIMRSHFAEGRARLQQALAHTRNVPDAVLARALNGAGVLALRQGDYTAAKQWFEQSKSLYERLKDLAGSAEVINNQGHIALAEGDSDQALACYEQSLDSHYCANSRWGQASALSSIGMIYRDRRNLDRSRACFETALAIWRDLGDDSHVAAMLSNLGMVLYDQADYVGARLLFTESLERYREQGNRWCEALCLNNLASTMQRMRHSVSARSLLKQSVALFDRVGDRKYIVHPLMELANIALGEGEEELAVRVLAIVEELSAQTNTILTSSEKDAFRLSIDELKRRQSEQAFNYAWEAGKAAGIDEIVRSL